MKTIYPDLLLQLEAEFRSEFNILYEEFFMALPELTNDKNRSEGVRKLFRIFHTIKSTGRAVGFVEVSELSHQIEDSLAVLRVYPENLDQKLLDSLIESLNLMKGHLDSKACSLDQQVNKMKNEFSRIRSPEHFTQSGVKLRWSPTHSAAAPADSKGVDGFESIFAKAQQVIQETSLKLGKSVELHCFDGGLRISQKVLSALSDPILHLVRNAVAHGIESRTQRLARWKGDVAKVYVKIVAIDTTLVIDVMDDGAGIDKEAVFQKANTLRIPSKAMSASTLTDAELLELLCTPGFSTADKAGEFSGRGVGLDIVLASVKKLGGTLSLFNRVEKGAVFKIRIPYHFEKQSLVNTA